MKYNKLITEMEWNEEDIKIASQAQSKLDKAVDDHNTMIETIIVPQRKKLVKELDDIENQEDGQGQRGDEIEVLKMDIKKLDDMTSKSQNNIDKLMQSVRRINQMRHR